MQTKIVGGGVVQPGTELAVDPTFQAARVAIRPLDYGNLGQLLGHYRVAGITGNVAAAGANGVIASLRWTDASRYLVLMRLEASGSVASAVTAQVTDIDAIIARAFTAVDSGGTSVLPTGNSNKNRVSMGSTLVNDLRMATTQGITAGTRTLDSQPFAAAAFAEGSPGMTTLGSAILPIPLYKWDAFGQHPIVLSQNEGIIVRTPTSVATGSIKYYVVFEWAEVALF